jgi:hypothetical protein
MKLFRHLLGILLLIPLLVSCNLYTPLNTSGSDSDKLEEAQVCLKDNDYQCAIDQYEKIEDAALKQQKLCQIYLTRGGITLSILVNVLNENSSKIIVNLGNRLLPWTSNKSADLQLAKTHCSEYRNLSSDSDASLLKVTALFSDCAIRMARTDRFQSTTVDDTCTLANFSSSNGLLTAPDIGGDGAGSIDTTPGMCSSDVNACVSDVIALKNSQSELSGLGFSDIGGAAGQLPQEIVDGVATNAARAALKGMFR